LPNFFCKPFNNATDGFGFAGQLRLYLQWTIARNWANFGWSLGVPCAKERSLMPIKSNIKCWARRVLTVVFACGLAVGAFALSVIAHHNFHTVSPGLVYRSAQMDAGALATVIREHGIRSIINLRGAGAGNGWYDAETNTSRQFGVQHFDYALSASRELTDEEMDQILATISNAPKPILIHCRCGADRTGLVGALYLYRLEGEPAQTADSQLTLFYGHVPQWVWSGTIAMDNSFWRYVRHHAQAPKSAVTTDPKVAPDEISSLAHSGAVP
jgi:protein tyrosine phosphatase (PTP) superfamily phosphohydrolase (DUF442 family)